MPDKDELRLMCMIQVLFRYRCMKVEEARQFCHKIIGASDDATWDETIKQIGEELSGLKMQVMFFTHFNDGVRYVAIINIAEDEAAKDSSPYSLAELQFFNHLVQSIAMTEGATPGVCSISSREALNIDIRGATQMTQLTQEQLDNASLKLTVGQKEKALLRLQADMWLGKDDTGNVTLGPRTFLELKNHLLELNLPESTKEVWSREL